MKTSLGLNIKEFAKENLNKNDKKCPFYGNVSIRGNTITGIVVSDKMTRTVKVQWDRTILDKKYNRYYKKTSSVLAHNSDSINAKVGDEVLIAETRPMSKRKHFTVVKVLVEGVEKWKQLEEMVQEDFQLEQKLM